MLRSLFADVQSYNADTKQGIIVDPTIRFEVECRQSADVYLEKKSIYEPTVNYFKLKYVLIHVELVQLPRFLHESLSSVRPVYVISVYKLTPSNGPKERSRRARDLTVASDNLSAIECRPGDFFFNVEPVIRNEATHRKIVFRVGILA
ncbi:hypothetical protein ANN_23277 [Periplaneta americana]|uniref:Uncharacterized protein n=1 Tax=Periplaneta americana TaxID=6978 RepID=A0ABQ8SKN4_PERAM|nr:hypothetical protein ANN_23277 [Periplaneta americana]